MEIVIHNASEMIEELEFVVFQCVSTGFNNFLELISATWNLFRTEEKRISCRGTPTLHTNNKGREREIE